MEKGKGKNKDGGKLAGILLTVTLVVCCVALFIMSEQGSKLISSFGTEHKQAETSPTDATPILSREAFIASAFKNGLEAGLTEKKVNERIALYNIERYKNCEGELVISSSNGVVTAFTLRFTMPYYQENGEDTSASQELLFERDKQSYNDYISWFSQIYAPLAFALDDAGKLSYAHIDASVNNLKNALGEDNSATEIESEYRQLISTTDNDGMLNVSVSLEKVLSEK